MEDHIQLVCKNCLVFEKYYSLCKLCRLLCMFLCRLLLCRLWDWVGSGAGVV